MRDKGFAEYFAKMYEIAIGVRVVPRLSKNNCWSLIREAGG